MDGVLNRFTRLLDQMDEDELISVLKEYGNERIFRHTLISYLSSEEKLNVIENFPEKMAACEFIRTKNIETVKQELAQAHEKIEGIDKQLKVDPNSINLKTTKSFVIHRVLQLREDLEELNRQGSF